jgi:hypothetical protein
MGAGLLAVESRFILFIKDYQFSLQINTLERVCVRACLPLHTYRHTCIYSEREGEGREGVREKDTERERGHRERKERRGRKGEKQSIYIEEKVYIEGKEVGLSEEIMKPNTDEGGWGVGVEP